MEGPSSQNVRLRYAHAYFREEVELIKEQMRTGTWGKIKVVSLAMVVFMAAGSVSGQTLGQTKLSTKLANTNPETLVDVIVQYKHKPTDVQHKKVTDRGGLLKSKLDIVRAGSYRITAGKLAEVANDPEVEQVVPDYEVRSAAQASVPITAIGGATLATWNGSGWGSGVGVAVIDSGISANNDLTGSVVFSKSFVEQGTSSYDSSTGDAYGHGTHVAGIIASSGTDSQSGYNAQYFGMASSVNLLNLRVLGATGSGRDSDVIAAIQEAIALQSQYNIKVINLSLGRAVHSSYTTDPLCQTVEAAWKAGITVVVAAGNFGRDNSYGEHGYGTITAPGNDPYVITVGATNDKGTYSTTDDVMTSA
jgi:serine protease AprX